MKREYDFSKGKRGAVEKTPRSKQRITIRLDRDVINWFRSLVEETGGGNYQTMINKALKEFITYKQSIPEDNLRNIIREELLKLARQSDFTFRPSETAVTRAIKRGFPKVKIESFAETSEVVRSE